MQGKDRRARPVPCFSAVEYLTFVAATGGSEDAIER